MLCTALLLMRRQALLGALPWARLWLLNALAMALAAGLLFRIDGIWLQLGLGTVAGCWRCSAWRSGCGPGAPIDPWLRVGSLALGAFEQPL